ncbi:hypothetical protein M3Y96_00609300 [Aphelenchoides besseyi]|nr:hypothetical protein M3Y96_00609300 [Aphelenchoides besseyi]
MFSLETRSFFASFQLLIITISENSTNKRFEMLRTIYTLLVYFNYVIVFGSVFVCAYFIRTLRRSQLVHPNLKTILCLYAALTVTIGCTRSVLEVLYALDFAFPFLCQSFSFLNAFSTGFLQLCLMAIFFERVLATFRAHEYESQRGTLLTSVGLGIMFIYACLFATFVIVFDKLTSIEKYPTWKDTCLSLSRRPLLLVSGWVIYALVTLPLVPFNVYLVIYNKRLLQQRGVGNLSTRYMYSENAIMLKAIIQSLLILNLVFGIIGLIAIAFIVSSFLLHRPVGFDFLIAMKVSNLCIDFGCTLHYIMILAFHPVLGTSVRRVFRFVRNWRRSSVSVETKTTGGTTILPSDRETEIYFRELHDLWNK